jgi:hypothetical protein
MPEYRTKYKTMSYRYPGKMEMGFISADYNFIPIDTQNSEGGVPFFAITRTKWVMVAACELTNPVPPPPPPVEPPDSDDEINLHLNIDKAGFVTVVYNGETFVKAP